MLGSLAAIWGYRVGSAGRGSFGRHNQAINTATKATAELDLIDFRHATEDIIPAGGRDGLLSVKSR